MVDLHSHVLFGIDDGAENIEESIQILKAAENIGIKKIMATPHFAIGDDVDEFIRRRENRFNNLCEAIAQEGIDIKIKAGAEVYITEELFNEQQLKSLTLGDSNVILCEFKYHSLSPESFLEYIDYIKEEGFTPLVAHVERYSFVRENPLLVKALLSRDVLLQVNAISLFEDSEDGEFARALYRNKVIYAVGSDTHHAPSRRCKAMGKLWEKDSGYMKSILFKNPDTIFENN